jgi:hypothetical protein
MHLRGKGFYIWKLADAGDAAAIYQGVQQAGLTHVLIKIADGIRSYNVDQTTSYDLVPDVLRTLKAHNVQVWGWHYVYGIDPAGEANIALRRIHELGLDGYVVNAETEFKQPGRDVSARILMTRLRSALPDFPMALSSYRYPSVHPQFPWKTFLEYVDYNMPQVYWLQNHNPAEQLNRCVREFQAIQPFRPIIPTGAAFKEYGWEPYPSDAAEFLQAARSLNLEAANFWEWTNCRRYLPAVWLAIQNYAWDIVPLPEQLAKAYITALNSRDVEQVVSLYTPNAVHVTPTRTIQGLPALREWYRSLFSEVLPEASFALVSSAGDGAMRSLTWTARATTGRVQDGSDTLGVVGGKIAYHYTAFKVVK